MLMVNGRHVISVLVVSCLCLVLIRLRWMTKDESHADVYVNHAVPSDTTPTTTNYTVDVWGQTIISGYLWKHILEGDVTGIWDLGLESINDIKFTYRSGETLSPKMVSNTSTNMLLIIRGHESGKLWLESLSRLPQIERVGVVFLGSEQCDNTWVHQYMKRNGGRVSFMFLVYDCAEIDNVHFYQWPLGVSAHRGFPNVDSRSLGVTLLRKFMCSFLGSGSTSGSRKRMLDSLNSSPYKKNCFIKIRKYWSEGEDSSSSHEYVQSLRDSDLTLSPVGQNTECFRIYEAMTFGSVPVIEDVMTSGRCGRCNVSDVYPLRLLKENEAPVIYIKDWSELPTLLERESRLSQAEKVYRRKALIEWYSTFKLTMKNVLISTIYKHFFDR